MRSKDYKPCICGRKSEENGGRSGYHLLRRGRRIYTTSINNGCKLCVFHRDAFSLLEPTRSSVCSSYEQGCLLFSECVQSANRLARIARGKYDNKHSYSVSILFCQARAHSVILEAVYPIWTTASGVDLLTGRYPSIEQTRSGRSVHTRLLNERERIRTRINY
jgi:hypothetical protein